VVSGGKFAFDDLLRHADDDVGKRCLDFRDHASALVIELLAGLGQDVHGFLFGIAEDVFLHVLRLMLGVLQEFAGFRIDRTLNNACYPHPHVPDKCNKTQSSCFPHVLGQEVPFT
jgi:hypothetical protein